jgi:hypothetical protein
MRKDNEALAQREKPVETEAVEIEGFVLDFEGTIENAKNVARYAKEVVGAKGVTLTKFSSTTLIFSLLIDNKFSSS